MSWPAAGVVEATTDFRRLTGKADRPKLRFVRRESAQQLAIGNTVEHMA